MARVWLFLHLFLLFSPNLPHPVKALLQSPRTAGVFLLTEGGKYTFSFSAARAACLQLNVTIASKRQVERALQQGLETCKFGWTADRMAVIPRWTVDVRCGRGKTGALTWATSEDQKFGVFCFDASDLEESSARPTPPRSATYSSTLTSRPPEPPLASSAGPPPPASPTVPDAPLTPAFTQAATSTGFPSTSTSGTDSSTRRPTSAPQPIASTAAVVSWASSASGQHNLPASSESARLPSTNAPEASLGDLPTALIALASILMLLMAAAVVWCYKLCWLQRQRDDCTVTEMWGHSDSELDLGGPQGEESDRKYSSDITMCVNPQFSMTSE